MGRRGPPAKPLELVKKQGNPGKQKLNDDAPAPERAINAKPPFTLKGTAKKIWTSMTEKLERLGVLAETDLYALARYADLHARWLALRDLIDKKGITYEIKTEKGSVYLAFRPEVSLFNKWIPILARLEQEFGLTPASRTRIRTDGGENDKQKARARLYGRG